MTNTDSLPCPHSRPDWRMCPWCQGINEQLPTTYQLRIKDAFGNLPIQIGQEAYEAAMKQLKEPGELRAQLAQAMRERDIKSTTAFEMETKLAAAQADNARLRSLIKQVDESAPLSTCPWCRIRLKEGCHHDASCAAFNPDGTVK